jgi:hypothetical protein
MSTYELLTNLAACLCAQIEADESPATCFCGVVAGSSITEDYLGDCDVACGMAWVRLASSYPASVVGVPDETPGNCGKMTGLDIEMGILRCEPQGEYGEPPTAQQRAEAAEQQVKDMVTMKRAIKCCSSLRSKDVLLGLYAPAGPRGGLVGGAWTFATVL